MSDAGILASSFEGRGHSLYDRALFVFACFVFAMTVLLGGGTAVGLPSDEIAEIISVPLLVVSAYRLFQASWQRGWGLPLALLLLVLLFPLLQLVPLPPAVWQLFPGRDAVVEVYEAAGLPIGWRPLSLAPHATIYAFLAMIPPAALFLTALQLGTARRYALLTAPLVVGGLSALLGLAQLFGNSTDANLGGGANVGYAIGFFANRNHFAALVYTLLPLAIVWTVHEMRSPRGRRFWAMLLGGTTIIALLAGLSVAFSRAGVALGIVAVLGSAFIVWRSAQPSRLGRWPVIVAGVALVAFAVVLQLGFIDLLIQRSTADSARQSIARLTLEAIQQYSYAGSGFGTFVPVYKTFERANDLLVFYINHAHNDWLELVLEGGVGAAALLLLFLGWFATRFWSIWLSRSYGGSADHRMLASAASLSILLLLLHSLLDYPLRTTTLLTFFAVACALLCASAPEAEGSASRRERHSSSGRSSSRRG